MDNNYWFYFIFFIFFDKFLILVINLCSVLVNFPTTNIIISLKEIINCSINLSVWALYLDNSSSISSSFIIISNLSLFSSSFSISSFSVSLFSFDFFSFNKGVSNPAESRIQIPSSSPFSPCEYLILIPFVSIL